MLKITLHWCLDVTFIAMKTDDQELSKTLEAVINTAIDGIIIIDKKGIVELINPAAAALFEYAPEDVIGNNISMLMPQPHRKQHDGYIDRYVDTREPRIIGIGREVEGLRSGGSTFPFRLAVSEVILHNRTIFTGIIHDLSDFREAQSEILALNRQLENKVVERTYDLERVVNQLLQTNEHLESEILVRKEAEHKLKLREEELELSLATERELNELKSRFVSMASHEFRTPLASILSSAALIGRYSTTEQQENREKHVGRIKSAVNNLTGILNDFLSLSKLEEGKEVLHIEAVKMRELFHTVQQDIQSILKPHQIVSLQWKGMEEDEFETDPRIVKNILFNLISNAIKYSDNEIICRMEHQKAQLSLEIIDQGIGIPLEDQKHMFTRFFRAANVTNIQGTGLGLNIVLRYVTMLKGTISFESEAEIGTTFTVVLPKNVH